MTKDEDDLSAERQALADAKSALVESAAIEVVTIGRALFKDGEPSDPELQRRYRLYKRLEAALERPAGPQRLEALIRRTANSEQIRLMARTASARLWLRPALRACRTRSIINLVVGIMPWPDPKNADKNNGYSETNHCLNTLELPHW